MAQPEASGLDGVGAVVLTSCVDCADIGYFCPDKSTEKELSKEEIRRGKKTIVNVVGKKNAMSQAKNEFCASLKLGKYFL